MNRIPMHCVILQLYQNLSGEIKFPTDFKCFKLPLKVAQICVSKLIRILTTSLFLGTKQI